MLRNLLNLVEPITIKSENLTEVNSGYIKGGTIRPNQYTVAVLGFACLIMSPNVQFTN